MRMSGPAPPAWGIPAASSAESAIRTFRSPLQATTEAAGTETGMSRVTSNESGGQASDTARVP